MTSSWLMKRSIYIALIGLLALYSCKDSKNGFEEGYESAQNEAQEATAEDIENSPNLYLFDGGTIEANDKNLFAQGDTYKGEKITLSDAFFVIKHPDGILLWDTGLPENLVGQDPFTTADGAFTISRQDSIVDQLASIGLLPEDVKYIAFSHIHFDHTGGANHFPDATWLVQQSTADFMNSDGIKGNSFYDMSSFEKLTKKQVLNGDYDVFNDGKVVIKYLPGHTAGHQGLFVDLAQTGPLLLTGDTYHFRQNRLDTIIPQINYSIPESEVSINTFENFAKNKNAKVFIQHDMEDFKMMPKAPKIIE